MSHRGVNLGLHFLYCLNQTDRMTDRLTALKFSMQVHHEKELDHLKRMMERKEEELVRNQAVERRALPKRIRAEMKAREMMFR